MLSLISSTHINEALIGGIKVYPNPAKDRFVVELPSTNLKNAKIKVIDLLGRTINTIDDCIEINTIMINIQTRGFYIVKIIYIGTDNVFKLAIE